jgi:hypothetical protein
LSAKRTDVFKQLAELRESLAPRGGKMRSQRTILAASIMLLAAYASAEAQQPYPFPEGPPAATVQEFWAMASRGELLTPEGWEQASHLFTVPSATPNGNAIRVFSDHFAVNASSVDGDKAKVEMEYVDLGQIDKQMRYTPPVKTSAFKTSFGYNLISVQWFVLMRRIGQDGKMTVEKKEVPGRKVWQIEGQPPAPFLTVNAAIRYVVEAERKTTDADIKANAEASLTKLLELH